MTDYRADFAKISKCMKVTNQKSIQTDLQTDLSGLAEVFGVQEFCPIPSSGRFTKLGLVQIVIFHESRRLKNPGRTTSAIRANRMLILNLAVSDFLMGAYLLSLGTVAVKLQVCRPDCAQEYLCRVNLNACKFFVSDRVSTAAKITNGVLDRSACRWASFR